MHANPFSPSFAILPQSFYGRSEYIEDFGKALDTPNSAWRFFFLTGTRGSGKTSLLHQYEVLATKRRWDVIKGTNIDILNKLLHYASMDKSRAITKTLRPSAAGVALGELSSTTTAAVPLSMLSERLIAKLQAQTTKHGLAIMIDEAQKLAREDAVRIGNAVQDAHALGLPIALVLCGLPNAYRKIRGYDDCTFLRRMKRVKLWTMKRAETEGCFRTAFAAVPELVISDAQLARICSFSGGHPYLIQLIGDNIYRLVEQEINPPAGIRTGITDELISLAEGKSLTEFKHNVLDDVMTGAHEGTREYLYTCYQLRQTGGRVDVSAVNAHFGKNAREMSSRRDSALNTQVIKTAERNSLKFALPHYELIFEDYDFEEPETTDDEWDY